MRPEEITYNERHDRPQLTPGQMTEFGYAQPDPDMDSLADSLAGAEETSVSGVGGFDIGSDGMGDFGGDDAGDTGSDAGDASDGGSDGGMD